MYFTIWIHLSAQNAIKHLSNIDGLSNNSINCFLEDSQRTLWIGTWDGLNSYNGRDFKTYRYNKLDNRSISNNVIRQILEQDESFLWVVTDYGVNRFDRKTQEFKRFFGGTDQKLPQQEKSFMLAVSSAKQVFCFIKGYGLYILDLTKDEFVPMETDVAIVDVNKIIIDGSDNLFFLQDNGALLRSKITDSRTGRLSLSFFEEDNISDLFFSDNRLIIVYPGYIKVWDDINSFPNAIDTDHNKTISQIISNDDILYICFYEGSCIKYDLRKKQFSDIDNIPSHVSFFSIYIGSQDILWLGTDGQGVFQIYDYNSPFKTFHTNYPVRGFCQANEWEMLIGTKGSGIKKLDTQKGILSDYLDTSNGLISNSAYTIKKNRAGDIFIGTEGYGINVIDGETNKLSKIIFPEKKSFIRAIYSLNFSNNDSVLWAGTSGHGLIKILLRKKDSQYFGENIKQYISSDGEHSLNNNIIYTILSGNKPNQILLGTRGGGLNFFNTEIEIFGQLDSEQATLSLTNNDVLSLLRAQDSTLWIGTSYGLNHLCKDQIIEYTVENGIQNNTIHGILEDKKGSIWISTNQGISHIIPATNQVENYSAKDGLQNNEFSDGAYYKSSSGNLFFGGVGGLNFFDPDEIHLRHFDPEISLSALKIYNTIQSIPDKIVDNTLKLSADEPHITLTFIAKDYINNENCEYAYRLINFSDEWVFNGNNPNVVFTKLPPGKYQLQVKCTNGDKVWSNQIYNLNIEIAYPWFLSLPAFIAYFIIIVSIAYVVQSVIRNRIRLNRQLLLEHIEKQNQQKMHESKLNFFTNVAHEFFTPLTLIYGPAEHLLERANLDSYTKRYIQIIKNNADRMQKLISELMDFRKAESGHTPLHPESIDLKILIDYISDNYIEIIQENKIDYKIYLDNVSEIVSDRNSLEKILFNLISNAFKYTPNNGYIHVFLKQMPDGTLQIQIKNSGRGLTDKQKARIFDQFKIFETTRLANSRSTGIGLNLTQSLVQFLGGNISVNSVVGEYVEFNVLIPQMEEGNIIKSDGQTEELLQYAVNDLVPQNRKEITIMLVEDEKNIRDLLRDILSPYYHIREASDGQKALREIETNRPDIIISDILMPNLDGISMIDHLKTNPLSAHIPIISISAKSSAEDHINAYKHGADLYITKPFHPRHVLSAVENLINKYSILKDYFNSSRSAITVKDGVTMQNEDQQLLDDVIAYVEKNIEDESLNPNSISDLLGISKATLYRKLKDLTGKTPSEYIRTIRLQYASNLLITSNMTVSEIMFRAGFSNKSYFFREFSKLYNKSPKEYRETKKLEE